MTTKRVILDNDNYLQQFHNMEHYDLHGAEEGVPMSWELPPVKHRDVNGSVISQLRRGFARGGDVMHTRKVPKPHTPVVGERQHKSHHPAMMIPGVHVIGAIHGIPYFTGKK